MCFNRSLNNKINNVPACCKTIENQILKNFSKEMVDSIYHQNIKYLSIEMFKAFKGISPQIIIKKEFSV